jgi:hypothetical protein
VSAESAAETGAEAGPTALALVVGGGGGSPAFPATRRHETSRGDTDGGGGTPGRKDETGRDVLLPGARAGVVVIRADWTELTWVKTRLDTAAAWAPLTVGPDTAAWPCTARVLKLSARTACVVVPAAGGTTGTTAAANRNRSSSVSRVGLVGQCPGTRPGFVPAAL